MRLFAPFIANGLELKIKQSGSKETDLALTVGPPQPRGYLILPPSSLAAMRSVCEFAKKLSKIKLKKENDLAIK